MPIQNAEIAGLLEEMAELLDIEGANAFRARAYRRAARTIESLPQSAANLLEAGNDLADLPGIGKDLAGKIGEIVRTGRFAALEVEKRAVPAELAALAALPGLGPKRVKLLHDELGVRGPNDLRKAVAAGRVAALRGFGRGIEDKLKAALAKPVAPTRFKLANVEAEAEALLSYLKPALAGGQAIVAGSFRRRKDTVGDLDVLATSNSAKAVGERFVAYDNVDKVLAHGETRSTVVLRSGLQIDLRVVANECFGAALLYFTGSKAHNIALRAIAVDKGLKLNEYGLFDGQKRVAGATEKDVYRALGLAYVPPELREDRGEIDLARRKALPRLVQLEDIRGDLHAHTNWSDGAAPLQAMAAAAQAKGYEYLAITDHSLRMTVAHGLDAKRLAEQIDAIDRVNGSLEGFALLKGVEVDILEDGSLDLADDILSRLDIVVASIHSHFDLPRDQQTRRLVRAVEHPLVAVIGHPTGRLIGEREPLALDFDAVLAAARKVGCALEINAAPPRLDLDDVHAYAAREAGVKLVISTDAHATVSLDWMRFGVDQARRGWIGAGDVVNTVSLADLRRRLKPSRAT